MATLAPSARLELRFGSPIGPHLWHDPISQITFEALNGARAFWGEQPIGILRKIRNAPQCERGLLSFQTPRPREEAVDTYWFVGEGHGLPLLVSLDRRQLQDYIVRLCQSL